MRILSKSDEQMEAKKVFILTKSPTINRVRDSVGLTGTVSAWVLFEDVDRKDPEKVNTILSFMMDDVVYATNSKTFQDMFMDIVSIMGNTGFEIVVIEGKSKAGRTFVTCGIPM